MYIPIPTFPVLDGNHTTQHTSGSTEYYFDHLMRRADSLEKTHAVQDGRQEKAAAEAGWHHQHNGHESEQIPGAGEGQGSLASCSPWCCKCWTRLSN